MKFRTKITCFIAVCCCLLVISACSSSKNNNSSQQNTPAFQDIPSAPTPQPSPPEDPLVKDLVSKVRPEIEALYPGMKLEYVGYDQSGKHYTQYERISFIISPSDKEIYFKLMVTGNYDNVNNDAMKKKYQELIKKVIQLTTTDDVSTVYKAVTNLKKKDDFESVGEYVGKKVHYIMSSLTFDSNFPPTFAGTVTR